MKVETTKCVLCGEAPELAAGMGNVAVFIRCRCGLQVRGKDRAEALANWGRIAAKPKGKAKKEVQE